MHSYARAHAHTLPHRRACARATRGETRDIILGDFIPLEAVLCSSYLGRLKIEADRGIGTECHCSKECVRLKPFHQAFCNSYTEVELGPGK